jgi:1-phosphofructokinase
LNPAIDRTVEIDSFHIDHVNRVKRIRRDIGGKGLNVTKTINAMGGDSKALLVLGGENGAFIRERAHMEGLNILEFSILENTRENIKIVDPVLNTFTDINESGPVLSQETCEALALTLTDAMQPEDWLVISGSAPKGVDGDFYRKVFEHAASINIKIIADVSGPQLKSIIALKPWLIKPNIHELGELFGITISNTSEAVVYARKVIQKGVKIVVVSMGEDGLLWVDAENAIHANAVKVPVKSTVGAGDAIVAGLALGLSRDDAPERIIKKSIAAATCVITSEGSMTGDMAMLDAYQSQIKVTAIEKA